MKKIGLAIAGGLFVLIILYQFVFTGGSTPQPVKKGPAPEPHPQASSGTVVSPPGKTDLNPQGVTQNSAEAKLQLALADMTPLDLDSIRHVKDGGETKRSKTIFEFWVEPPKPPPVVPPPTPYPIALRMLQPQSAVAGTPKPIELKVSGAQFPPDAQILFGAVPKQTKRLSDTMLSAEVSPAEYTVAGSVQVQVRSASDPVKLISNIVGFQVQPAPAPPFKMVGVIGDLAVLELGSGTRKEYVRLRRGDTFEGVWRIDAVSENGVEVTDTRYEIKRVVPMEQKAHV